MVKKKDKKGREKKSKKEDERKEARKKSKKKTSSGTTTAKRSARKTKVSPKPSARSTEKTDASPKEQAKRKAVRKASVPTTGRKVSPRPRRKTVAPQSPTPITSEQISLRAYLIWEERSRRGKSGSPEDDWAEARRQLLQEKNRG